MLYYRLVDNKLSTAGPNDRLARPVDVRTKSRADLIRDITGPGSILKPTESDAVIDNYWRKITDYLRQGMDYSDDYISIRFGIKGTFNGDEDEFDPSRHRLTFNSNLTKKVTEAATQVPLRKADGRSVVPEIDHVFDWGSGTTDERLSPGEALVINGEHLKIHDNLEEEEGVFFISQSDDSEIRTEEIRTNKPKTLALRIPEELIPGNWRLEVRNTRYDGKTLRTGTFIPVLRVE